MGTHEQPRANGRADHPIPAIWNSLLAGIVFEHASIARRELRRNAQLREMCGFDPIRGCAAVPSKSAYSRFLATLVGHEPLVREMFNALVRELSTLFPDFGKNLAGDGKPSKKPSGDKRRETDADRGVKAYSGINEDGKAWEKIKSWFRLHLIAEADAELPIAYAITPASHNEQPVMRKLLAWKVLYNKRPIIERVNSRIDVSFGFERHYIRGIKKMELRCGLSLSVMLAIAVGRLRQAHPALMRSLVKVAV